MSDYYPEDVRSTDRYVVRCNNFDAASRYAAEHNWELREWSWMPAYTISKKIQIFERMRDDQGND